LEKDAPLIREQFDSKDLLAIKHPKHLVSLSIRNKVVDIVIRSGVQQKEKSTESKISGRIRKNIPMCHGFRKFAITKMAEADLNYEIRERLVGHTIGLSQRYVRFSEQKYIQEYWKAVDSLTINEENRLKRKVAVLTIKSDELTELKNELNDFKKWKDDLTKEYREILDRSGAKQIQQDKEHEEYRVEWIRKENEQRKKLGLNLYDKDAFKI
jgi:hypothetical protein